MRESWLFFFVFFSYSLFWLCTFLEKSWLISFLLLFLPFLALEREPYPLSYYGLFLSKRQIFEGVLWVTPALSAYALFLWLYLEWNHIFWSFSFSPSLLLTQCFSVALPEEFFFRGYLQSHWQRLRSPAQGILLVSLLFALGHILLSGNLLRGIVFFPSLFFGWLRYKTKGLFAPTLCHGLGNTLHLAFLGG